MSHPPAALDAIRVQPLTSSIGAEISGLALDRAPDSGTASQLVTLLNRWRVLFFRNQPIDDGQFLAFGRSFGTLTPAHPIAPAMAGHPEIWERRFQLKAESTAMNPNPAMRPQRDVEGWHIDISFMVNPNRYSILRAVSMPACGGDTLWSNLAQAYAGLSPPIRALVDGLTAVHRTGDYDGSGGCTAEERKRRPASFAAEHPLVRIHPGTGERILFFNPGVVTHIVGLKERESRALIDLLSGEISRSEYSVRFRWSADSLAIWDNQATAHAGPIDCNFTDSDRVVRRITVSGNPPVGATGFRSRSLMGEPFGIAE
jgi:alpha-ketoglutarate-dependent taurine dioxygenase